MSRLTTHDEGAGAGALAAVPKDFVFLDTAEGLREWTSRMAEELAAHPEQRCCLDTEADSLHHYGEKICLLQVACAGHFALVDPLAIADMRPLLELLDQRELWFHGADYDLSLLQRTYGWSPSRMRDTQIAARLVGHRQFGLAALVKEMVNIELSKASQKADWSRRPLPDVMLRYAVDDVRHLLFIADRLLAELHAKGRHDWFIESCHDLQVDVTPGSGAKASPRGATCPSSASCPTSRCWLTRNSLKKGRKSVPPRAGGRAGRRRSTRCGWRRARCRPPTVRSA